MSSQEERQLEQRTPKSIGDTDSLLEQDRELQEMISKYTVDVPLDLQNHLNSLGKSGRASSKNAAYMMRRMFEHFPPDKWIEAKEPITRSVLICFNDELNKQKNIWRLIIRTMRDENHKITNLYFKKVIRA